jgi:hypothetical protein
MKRPPEFQRIVDRMAPGILCRDGFLGDDPRPLEDILEADNSAVVGLGTSHEEIADRLEAIYQRARAAFGHFVEINDRLTARFREVMGRIPSPWPGDGIFPKGEVELRDAETGRTLCFTALSMHLIRAHGFYQGRGSPYRLEPAELAELFGLGE